MARGKGKGNAEIINKPVAGSSADDILEATATKMNGGDGDDYLSGSDAIERINAGDGDDTIYAGGGDDTIFGNDGTDTLVLDGSLRDAILSEGKGNSYILTTDAGGADTIKHIEFLQFDDFTYHVGVNNGVFTSDDSASTDEDTAVTIDVLANDFDFEGDSFSITSFDTTSANGASVSLVNGKLVYDSSNAQTVQDLNDGENIVDTFTYTVIDSAGNSSTETVSVEVQGVSDDLGGGDVFAGLGVNPEDTPIVENWVPGGLGGYWSDIANFTSGDDVHTLNVNNTVYSWLDDGWMGRQTGYSFYEGDDVFAVRLGANGGQGNWSRSGVDMGDGDDVFAIDLDSSGNGGIDGWHNGAQFVAGTGHDEFRFDIDAANYAYVTGQRMWMGDGNDSIDITVDVANAVHGHYGYGNNVALDAGDDTYSIAINVQDGSAYNLLTGYWRAGAGDDTMSFAMSGEATNADQGFGGLIYGDEGNDTFIFNVEQFTTNVWGFGANILNGGADYDTLVLEMGTSSDYTLTDIGGGSYDLAYKGVSYILTDVEEVHFTDGDVVL